MRDTVELAVNGTLMRGLELNPNLLNAGAVFIEEILTEPAYRLWSIHDVHPAMVRVADGGRAIAVEVWSVPAGGIASILLAEPPGLSIGKVKLADGRTVLGVLGEPVLCEMPPRHVCDVLVELTCRFTSERNQENSRTSCDDGLASRWRSVAIGVR